MHGMTFGQQLRAWRKAAKRSLRSLASEAALTYSYLSKIETGAMPPPALDTILHLAMALKQDTDILLTLAGRIPPDIERLLLNNPHLYKGLRCAEDDAPLPPDVYDIAGIKHEARQQALEDACKAQCEDCANNVPMICGIHHENENLCQALKIRALMEPKEGQTG